MLQIILLVIAILFIVVVLVQQKNSNLGSMMGGDAGEEMVQTRRGVDKILHRLTIILAILLLGGGIYMMFLA